MKTLGKLIILLLSITLLTSLTVSCANTDGEGDVSESDTVDTTDNNKPDDGEDIFDIPNNGEAPDDGENNEAPDGGDNGEDPEGGEDAETPNDGENDKDTEDDGYSNWYPPASN